MKVICVAGYKNSGKTTLVTRLVEALSEHGKVGTVKQMLHHRFNPQDTDTGKHFDAGADLVAAITDTELVIIKRDPTLEDALNSLADNGADFAIVEGAKSSDLPKIFLGEPEVSDEISNILVKLPERSDWDFAPVVELILDQPEWVTLDSLIRKVRSNPDMRLSGGIATFTGIVRRINDNVETTAIDFEKYEGVADRAIEKICFDMKQKDNIIDVLIHHKTGLIRSGEDIVYIVVAAAHRQELFQTLIAALERIKEDVPIWKKEYTIEGDFWVHDKL
ncbi:molybdopterin synthase subunit MoaE /molybdopterin guanine dinucleotide biosynthesis accessory protein MobB [Methanolobus vulcani]|jgi:molybdopterin synthase catalytic subunit|uniref:Molybdopterin synthase subunit MoaE /molybdopterin guanine dinucleotide biosynthesis accessory protein MobB n=1 Tax=Methanolobus vulcani TaxID=38026 RepID=A0A7Z7FED0_9EURY|nr:molybdopterin synthase [Methanolobus vulcani]MDK2826612.1 molybdopterin synthase catalytic subunit [Methanolobus sp.]MDK2948030.1 molybdopterin synthase catalytic subunit [Methanolobus sp.]SDF82256.1 molybdopterin synthase subunit MoaE /molybdopterin guanine dinucleotide biosynthesis accessory protein MobB [Methanolobus vulcani]